MVLKPIIELFLHLREQVSFNRGLDFFPPRTIFTQFFKKNEVALLVFPLGLEVKLMACTLESRVRVLGGQFFLQDVWVLGM